MSIKMLDQIVPLRLAIEMMREAQVELDRGNHFAIAAHLETALGFADAQLVRLTSDVSPQESH